MHAVSLLLLALTVSRGLSTYVSSRRSQSKRLKGAEAKDTFENVPLRICLLHCTTRRRCQSFNYNSRLGTCEIYQQTLCSRESYYLENSADWSWYDIILNPGSQSRNLVWSDDICQTGGRCQDAACLRELGDGCKADVQCGSAVTEGEASCTGGRCTCAAGQWKYNSTVCLRDSCPAGQWPFNDTLCMPENEQIDGGTYSWIWKKIMNGMCETEMDVQTRDEIRIVLGRSQSHYDTRYQFKLGFSGNSKLKGVRFSDQGDTTTFNANAPWSWPSNNRTTFYLHWCLGKLRVRFPGKEDVISWDDPKPFPVKYIGFYSLTGSSGSTWWLKRNLVDPWMEPNKPYMPYHLPKYSELIRREPSTTISMKFKCATPSTCSWEGRNKYLKKGASVYRIHFRSTYTNVERVAARKKAVQLTRVDTPNYMSSKVATSTWFQIKYNGNGAFQVYRQNQEGPFINVTDPSTPIAIRYSGFYNFGSEAGYSLALVGFDPSWGWQQGFRWGKGLW